MPVYGTAQAGSNSTLGLNLTALEVGEEMTLFSGTETPSQGLASVAFARAYNSTGDNGITFNLTGMPAGMVVDVQVAGTNVDGDYTSVAQLTGDTNGNAAYTDTGRSAFYRLLISAYTTGAMCVGTAQR